MGSRAGMPEVLSKGNFGPRASNVEPWRAVLSCTAPHVMTGGVPATIPKHHKQHTVRAKSLTAQKKRARTVPAQEPRDLRCPRDRAFAGADYHVGTYTSPRHALRALPKVCHER